MNSCWFLSVPSPISFWIFLGRISLPCLFCLSFVNLWSFLCASVRLGVNKTQFHFFFLSFFAAPLFPEPLGSSGRCCFARHTLAPLPPLHLLLFYRLIKKKLTPFGCILDWTMLERHKNELEIRVFGKVLSIRNTQARNYQNVVLFNLIFQHVSQLYQSNEVQFVELKHVPTCPLLCYLLCVQATYIKVIVSLS